MSFLTKKGIIQKIIISLLVVVLIFNFIYPSYVQAGIGGVLLNPLIDLVASLGDAVICRNTVLNV